MGSKRLTGAAICALLFAIIITSSVAARTATHKVRAGDTLWDLASRNHTTPKAIARANGIREGATLALGQSIRLPGKGGSEKHRPVAHARRHARVAEARHSAGHSASVRRAHHHPDSNSDGVESDASDTNDSGLIRMALACRGARYSRGGTSRGGFDCSGFTRYVYAKCGVHLPHSSAAQASIGAPVSRDELRAGDLVFFHTYRRGISHVGIYIGDGRFVHASTHGRGVTVDSLDASYYAPRYRGARRVKG